MSSHNQQSSSSRLLRDSSMTNLILVGDKAIHSSPREPSVTDYRPPIYQHSYRNELDSPLYNITHMYPQQYEGGSMSPDSGKGGFFSSPSRPGSAVSKGRPGSATSVRSQPNLLSRPPSGMSRPPSGMSRPPSTNPAYQQYLFSSPSFISSTNQPSPPSAGSSSICQTTLMSRCPSAASTNQPSLLSSPSSGNISLQSGVGSDGKKHVRFDRDIDDLMDEYNDPEYEPMSDVLTRLGEYTQNFVQETPVAYTDCECKTGEEKGFSRSSSKIEGADDSSDDEEEEEDGISIDVLLKTFHQYEEKGHSVSRQKAMITLIETYTSESALEEEALEKILHLLRTSVPQVQEACLILLQTCVKNTINLQRVLEDKLLDFLAASLLHPDYVPLRRHVLLTMEALFCSSDCKSMWLEKVQGQLLPRLLSMLRGAQAALEVKYAVCCVFRALAKHEEFVTPVIDNILPAVIVMRNASARFKEVYVEILTALLSQKACNIPPDLIDSSALPVTVSIVSEGPCGPQNAALHLLTCLTNNDGMIALMVNTHSLVPMLLCCIKESRCRRVRMKALEVMRLLCQCRRIGLCKELMLQLGGYLVPSTDPDSLSSLSQMSIAAGPGGRLGTVGVGTKQRHDTERHMWLGLEKFVELVKNAVFREGKVETDELGLVTDIHVKVSSDTSPLQLCALTHALHILQNICLWPLDRARLGFAANRVDLTHFTENEKQRTRLSKVNRGLTQAVWDKVGTVVTHLLTVYGDRLTTVVSRLDKNKQRISLGVLLEPEQVELVTSLLQLTLCAALCTCETFPQVIADRGTSKTRPKSPQKLKSSSSPSIMSSTSLEKNSNNVELQLKSQSDVGKSFSSDNNRYLVKDNPHLTNMRSSSSHQMTEAEKNKAELLQHREACTDRRLLRKCLYESGVLESVCPYLQCSEPEFQILVLQILRCLVQPLEERVVPKLSPGGQSSHGQRVRPKTAGAVLDHNKRLTLALHKMSPDMASLIKDALGGQTQGTEALGLGDRQRTGDTGGKPKVVDIPDNPARDLTAIQERLEEFATKSKLDSSREEAEKAKAEARKTRPVLDRCRPIAQQCREALITAMDQRIVMGIFTKATSVRKYYVLLLHDLVNYGESETHMRLSMFGCMPRLIDFLRVNEDNEILEITGLIIVRLLVSSDVRLKQLFNRHGGPQLLLSMAQYTTGVLKKEIATTLKTVSKVSSASKRRPMSAPASRQHFQQKAPDVWDHIQARWNQEDQVKTVLRQWIEEDHEQRVKCSAK